MTDGESEPLDGHPDAALVARVLEGDRAAFAEVYDRYADRLYDFAQSMLRNHEDAADAVADTFVTFAEKLPQLREPERLRPWLYAITRSKCLRRIKARGRTAFGGDEQLADMPDTDLAPDEAVAASALQQLVWDAAGGLSERDRALLDLHLRQGLDGAELGEAMGIRGSNAYSVMDRLRGQLERSLGAFLVAKTGRDDCSGLDSTLGGWDGEFSPLVRKRVARHVDGCPKCLARKAAMASPLALFAGVPAFAAPSGLRERVLDNVVLPGQASGINSIWRTRRLMGWVAAAVVIGALLFVPGRLGESIGSHPADSGATTSPGAPATAPVPSTSPELTPTPAQLEVTDRHLLLRHGSRSDSTTLRNVGGEPLDFVLRPKDDEVFRGEISGHLEPDNFTTVEFHLDKDDWPTHDLKTHIEARWAGGSIDIELAVKGRKKGDNDDSDADDAPSQPQPPIVINPPQPEPANPPENPVDDPPWWYSDDLT